MSWTRSAKRPGSASPGSSTLLGRPSSQGSTPEGRRKLPRASVAWDDRAGFGGARAEVGEAPIRVSLHRGALCHALGEKEREASINNQLPASEVGAANRALATPVLHPTEIGQRGAAKRRSVRRAVHRTAGLLQAHMRHGAQEADDLEEEA
eukprot:CAMPEP_0179939630 /NCGR_PEP_ID=MMETSP0983-20121128/15786_1 /TAXON_ID=483367 /ORGANISM="non described non described, Strain CCMP 2436" /LENGTH=150 /DNA_ID=CAMNT_0021846079 /DNA_START=779 /DNA_END=1227 /DNA_ORIENTATION=-